MGMGWLGGGRVRWQGMAPDDRSWLLIRFALGCLVTYVLAAIGIVIRSPELLVRLAWGTTALTGVVLVTLRLARRGQSTAGALVLLVGAFAFVTVNAMTAGGIESPGIQTYYLFVIIGGLLLGWRGAFGFAVGIVVLGAWMAAGAPGAQLSGSGAMYSSEARWFFLVLHTTIALFVVLAADRSQQRFVSALRSEGDARADALRQLEASLDVAGAGRFTHDFRTDRYRPDAAVVAMTGLTPDADGALPFAACVNLWHPDDRAHVHAAMAPLAQGAVEQTRVAFRHRHPTRGWRYLEASLLLQRNPDNSPRGATGLLLDLTSQHQTIHDLGERLKEMGLLYYATDALRGEPVDAAGTLTALLEQVPPAWQYPDIAEAHLTLGGLTLATPGWTGLGIRLEAPIETSNGSGWLAVEYRRDPSAELDPPTFLAEEEALLSAVAAMIASWWEAGAERDRFKQIEGRLLQAQRLEAVGTFASGIAHDFNNILAAVIGVAEAARDLPAASPTSVMEDLDQIVAAGRRGQALVRRIRMLGQRVPLVRKPVSLPALVQEIASLARPSAPPGVTLVVECAPDVPDTMADASQLHQVLLNLISNAFHASRDTEGRVVVRVSSAPPPDGSGRTLPDCLLTVSDSGTGMSAAVAARIFEPFFTTKGEEGTGLGLSTAHGIIRDHDGVIQVASVLGQGTTFEIRLPSIGSGSAPPEPDAPDRRWVSREAALAGGRVRSGTVLLVDDNLNALRGARHILEDAGFTCRQSLSPREAAEWFAAAPESFLFVLSDMDMPEMSGVELIRRLRTIRHDLPAVLCTGVDLSDVAPMLEHERIQWVQKPPADWELLRAVDLVVARAPVAGSANT